MLKSSQTTLTIVFLILIKSAEHIGSYATKEVVNVETIYNEKPHHLTKRMDLETCLGQFDVHKNTIIRTGESQAIGGKYLQGLELDTIEECQRLCCETDSCDVYIFESKKDGYCYLFECGSPENFHCKFTRHANYTSAVLTPVLRHAMEVTTPHPLMPHKGSSGISQQEWELSNLKVKPEVRAEMANDEPLANSFATTNEPGMNGNSKKSLNPEMGQSQKINSTLQCGRFQFACHSGECIAVYNACDGIPQCEDGSDEGPECPGAVGNNVALPKSSSDVGVGVNKPVLDLSLASLPQYHPSMLQQSAQQQLQSMQQQRPTQNQGGVPSVPAVNNREDPNVWETRKKVSGPPVGGNGNNGGNPEAQQAALGDGFTAYVNNRIPNHSSLYAGDAKDDVAAGIGPNTGGSTIEQSGLYISHLPAHDPNAVYAQQHKQHILLPPPPPPPPAPSNSNWQQQAIMNQQKLQQQQQNGVQMFQQQQQQQQQQLSLPQGPAFAMPKEIPTQQQQQVENVMQQQLQPAKTLVPSLPQPQQSQFPLTVGAKLGLGSLNNPTPVETIIKNEDSEEYEDSEEKSTEPPKKRKHKKVKSKSKDLQKNASQAFTNQPDQQQPQATNNVAAPITAAVSSVHEQYEIIHQNMALEFRDHDGQSERPGGAVLSLTLGLLITAALAILIGCRMRTVGRRARRLGVKTPYSHEADFLVNGMYL